LVDEARAPAELRNAAADIEAGGPDRDVGLDGQKVRVCVVEGVPLHRTPTDVPTLLRGAVEALEKQAAALDVGVTVDAPADLPQVRLDAEKIAWAVTTLVGNALRYVRRGTRRLPGGAIRVRVFVDRPWLAIAVDDDGPGIPQDKCTKLFSRGVGVRHGAGLALMVVRDVIVAHGGRIDVESKCDAFASGTSVTLRVPLA
jgi:signal transduction histidine kinase